MSLSMYQASVPVFARGMTNLAAILDKGAAHDEIGGFAGGVEFFKTLPSLDQPEQLRQFNVTKAPDAGVWLDSVKLQVLAQYNYLKDHPGTNGFQAAFNSPMLIKGSATIFDTDVSKFVFNGQVDIFISTDGKILIVGRLNFANDLVSASARLYADLSNVTSGKVVVLFLADVPDQVRLLTIDGKLDMGFRDANDQPVPVQVLPDATPVNGNLP